MAWTHVFLSQVTHTVTCLPSLRATFSQQADTLARFHLSQLDKLPHTANTRPDKPNMSIEAAPVAVTEQSKKGDDEGFLGFDSQKGTDTQSPATVKTVAEKQLEGEIQNENENIGNSNNSDEDEYPGRLTKVAVGFSLALAIFLVYLPYFHSFETLIL